MAAGWKQASFGIPAGEESDDEIFDTNSHHEKEEEPDINWDIEKVNEKDRDKKQENTGLKRPFTKPTTNFGEIEMKQKCRMNSGPNFLSIDAVKMISHIHGNLVSMEESLLHLRQNTEKKQLQPADVENFRKLLREVDHTIKALPGFENRLREVQKSLQKMGGPSVTKSVIKVHIPNADTLLGKSDKVVKDLKKIALLTAAPILVYIIYSTYMK